MRGWKILPLHIAVAGCYGVGAWALIMTVAPLVVGDVVEGSFIEWIILGFAGAVIASALEIFVLTTPRWSARLPLLADDGRTSGFTGAAIGTLAAVPAQSSLLAQILAATAFLVLAILAVRRGRRSIREQYETVHEHARLIHLHEYGVRVRASVLEATFTHSWAGGPGFVVTLAYETPSGRKESTERLYTSPAGAPIVGGTILLWFLGDGSDTENVDVQEDPDSIRDPYAVERYQDPD